ncbi:sex-determining protein fem-1-like, partial [Acanthaster planci]|uniref:Sex-determining protein fem-1-like n=1 Tax=Acanthaster planci TaxID=133434 RepID=A0A8B7XGR3_ACAPL
CFKAIEWLRTAAESFLERNQIPLESFGFLALAVFVAVTFIWCISNGCKHASGVESPRSTKVVSIFELAKTVHHPGHAGQVKALVSKLQFDVNFPIPQSGMTLFLYACISGHKDLVNFLLERGGDVSVANNDGDTCLYLATFACAGSPSQDLSILELLISAGCDVNAQNHKGNTALHWAASKGDINIIKLLLINGANPNIRNSIGMYPISMATNAGYLKAGKLLKISLPDPSTPRDMFEPHTPLSVRLGLLSPRKDHLALSPRPKKRINLS